MLRWRFFFLRLIKYFPWQEIPATPKPKSKFNTFLNMIGLGGSTNCVEIQVSETRDTAAMDFCSINLTTEGNLLKRHSMLSIFF